EVRLDRVRPRRVRRGEHQLDRVAHAPLAQRRAAVMVQVVEDHMDRPVIGELRADLLERAQRGLGTLSRFYAPEQTVLTDRIAAEELPGAVRLVIVRSEPLRPRRWRP